MYLKSLQLTNFRNYKTQEITFEKGITVILGQNAQGKTNLLEAIFLLTLSKSFRAQTQTEILNWTDDSFTRVQGTIVVGDEERALRVVWDNRGRLAKRTFVNGQEVKILDFVGNFNAVLFLPEDLNLVSYTPALRRRYLDTVISQISKKYLQAQGELTKILAKRNKILQRIYDGEAQRTELSFWDQKLIACGCLIIQERLALIEKYNQELARIYQKLADDQTAQFKLKYENTFRLNGNLEADFADALQNTLEKDIRLGQTSIGPQREDFIFKLNEKILNSFGSRGEFRTAILALKLAEIEFLKAKTGYSPVLLLDDVFSELDETRRAQLLGAINNLQAIITTTDQAHIANIKQVAGIFRVKEGVI